jgi:hypothetical protein
MFQNSLAFTCYNAQTWRLGARTDKLYDILMSNFPTSSKVHVKTRKLKTKPKKQPRVVEKLCSWRRCARPHYVNFLGEFFLQVWIYSLRLENFDSHFLTTVCTFVPKQVGWNSWIRNQTSTEIVSKRQLTYRSPYDPEATLFSNFKYLGSISHTSAPSLGIATWLVSYLILNCSWSCKHILSKLECISKQDIMNETAQGKTWIGSSQLMWWRDYGIN